MRVLYTVLFFLALPFAFFRLWRRGNKLPAYRLRWSERLGQAPTLNEHETVYWFHTVSVGEFIAAKPLIQHYLNQKNIQILITCTTPTGSERISVSFGNEVAHCYLPYDIPILLNRFLTKTKPSKFICLETELWPNLIRACKKNNIPIVLANARLSEKSAAGYARFPTLTRDMLSGISAAAIQNTEDAQRFITLGLNEQKSHSIGNIKFDLIIDGPLVQKAHAFKQALIEHNPDMMVWIAASTHTGEDEIILSAFTRVRKQHRQVRLIIVPRHPERFDTVHQLCKKTGLNVIRRSEQKAEHFDIMLGDTMGELLMLFGASDLAFIGGSFVDNGGHNYIEPAAWGLPIFSGTSTYNFRETAAELTEKQALVLVSSDKELAGSISRVVSDHALREKMGEDAKRVADKNRGALNKLIDIIDAV